MKLATLLLSGIVGVAAAQPGWSPSDLALVGAISARVEVPVWSNLVDSATETFGNLSAYKFISSSFTNPCTFELSRIQLLLFRQGTAAYRITNSVYSTSGVNPGTLTASATNTVTLSDLTTSATTNDFYFASGTTLTVGQTNHIGIVIDTVDASNYAKYRYLTTAGQGIRRSSDGASWNANVNGAGMWFVIYGYPQ